MKDILFSEQAMRFRVALRNVAKGRHGSRNLSREDSYASLKFLFSSESDMARAAAFLTAMRFKGTSHDEYLGFFDAIEEFSTFVTINESNLLNSNGPYDGRIKTMNLVPAACIVASSCGVPILMHSSSGLNPKRGVSSCDAIEAMGIPAFLDAPQVQERLNNFHFAAIHASRFSFGVERLRSVRESMFFRTFLHSCEVMQNPGKASIHIIGAAHDKFLEVFSGVLEARGGVHVMAVAGLEGSDELSTKETAVCERKNGSMTTYKLCASDFGLQETDPHKSLTAFETAKEVQLLFERGEGSLKDAVIYNAGIRIYLGKKANDIAEGIRLAKSAVENGQALAMWKKLREV